MVLKRRVSIARQSHSPQPKARDEMGPSSDVKMADQQQDGRRSWKQDARPLRNDGNTCLYLFTIREFEQKSDIHFSRALDAHFQFSARIADRFVRETSQLSPDGAAQRPFSVVQLAVNCEYSLIYFSFCLVSTMD
jgi:hypothetical protein